MAIGFEFVGLVAGGAFLGHFLGKILDLQEGVGPALGTLIGLVVASIITTRIILLTRKRGLKP